MAKKKVDINDRLTSSQVAISATVNMGDGFFQKFHHSLEFTIKTTDDADDLIAQAWEKVENELQYQIDEAFEFQEEEKQKAKKNNKKR